MSVHSSSISPNSSITKQRGGFSLVELLIASAAMAFVLVYTLGTFAANRNAYTVIDQVSEAHQNAMAVMTLVEEDLRVAGYMVPRAAAACGADSTTAPDTILLSDTDVIRAPDTLPSAFAGGNNAADVTTIPTPPWSAPVNITVADLSIDGEPTYDTDATAGADSDFRVGGGVILTDLDNPNRGVVCGIISSVNVGMGQIGFTPVSPAPSATLFGNWQAVPAHVYQVTAGGALQRDGSTMVSNVDDLQVAWFYDDDDDGQVDANEYRGDGTGPDLDTSTLADSSLLREIRFNLVMRTSEDDPTEATVGIGQPTENQTNAPGPDGRRRRMSTVTIRLRNLAT